MGNKNLIQARKAKKDEFYTQLSTIEDEVRHYRKHFKGKTVYLNCDDPRESNFFHYFSYNFERLGLKKLIASCYKSQDFNLFSLHDTNEKAVWLEYTGEKDGGRVPTAEAIGIHHFKGDGDFRSEESIELLKEADIVVTNPPFSLFREYIAQLMEYDKKFLVIGNSNAIINKDIFPLIKDNKMWQGVSFNRTIEFEVPDHYDTSKAIDKDGKKIVKVPAISWWTNLEYPRRKQDIILFREYKGNEEKYPKYDNYDAINVDKVADIPKDYEGVMGVPITFIGKWNPEQFEMMGMAAGNSRANGLYYDVNYTHHEDDRGGCGIVSGELKYPRILIRNKHLNPELYAEETWIEGQNKKKEVHTDENNIKEN